MHSATRPKRVFEAFAGKNEKEGEPKRESTIVEVHRNGSSEGKKDGRGKGDQPPSGPTTPKRGGVWSNGEEEYGVPPRE